MTRSTARPLTRSASKASRRVSRGLRESRYSAPATGFPPVPGDAANVTGGERHPDLVRRVRRLISVWQSHDPPAWVAALVGMALGLGLFLLALALLAAFSLAGHLSDAIR